MDTSDPAAHAAAQAAKPRENEHAVVPLGLATELDERTLLAIGARALLRNVALKHLDYIDRVIAGEEMEQVVTKDGVLMEVRVSHKTRTATWMMVARLGLEDNALGGGVRQPVVYVPQRDPPPQPPVIDLPVTT
jgi:hypothetical protein